LPGVFCSNIDGEFLVAILLYFANLEAVDPDLNGSVAGFMHRMTIHREGFPGDQRA
jgi:hypothetical protein